MTDIATEPTSAASLRRHIEQLTFERDEAVRSLEARTRLLAHISHELRTPMNSVLGMTRLALQTELTAEQRDYMEVVASSSDSLLTLVNDLLDHAKLEAGKLAIEAIPFSFGATVRDAVRTLELAAAEKALELRVDVDPAIPDRVVGDPTRLRQVLLNLIGNAVKFTDAGHIAVTAALRNGDDDPMTLHLTVTDTGVGIPPDRLDAIFQAFEQAEDSTGRRYGGTGLGLAITSQIVDLMGGRIWVVSEVGVGSAFHFTMQVVREAAAPARPAGTRPGGPDLPILVYTDSPMYRTTLIDVLTEEELQPRMLEDPVRVARELVRTGLGDEPFGLIVLALQESGLAIAEDIMPAAGTTPVMVLTPSGQRGDAARCRQLGVVAYLTGPIESSDLRDAIRAVLADPPELITRHWLRERRRPLRVLVADDSPSNRMLATRILEKQGHTVTATEDGDLAVAAVLAGDFDVVLMDVHMPGLDGYAATRQIRRAERESVARVPIIALTGSVDDAGEAAREAGMDAFLGKPFRAEDLIELVSMLVGRT